MTTAHTASITRTPPKAAQRPRLRTVRLSRIQLPPEHPFGKPSDTRFPDFLPTDEALAVVTLLRPPVLAPTERAGYFQAIGNVRVIAWLTHMSHLQGDPDPAILALVVPGTFPGVTAINAITDHLILLLFDRLSTRAGRASRRELKAASLAFSRGKLAAANQRFRPLLRHDQ